MTQILSGSIFLGLGFLGLAGALFGFFEAGAIFTGRETPTISQLASGSIANHWPLALISAGGIGAVLGALATHFTNWRP